MRAEKAIFANRSNSYSMVHTKLFHFLEVTKCVFDLKYDLHSCSSYFIRKLSTPKFRSTYSTVVGLHVRFLLILRYWKAEESQLEIYRFNVPTDFGGVLKLHFGLMKMRCLPTTPIHIVWYDTFWLFRD
jgi:hypothetical protein